MKLCVIGISGHGSQAIAEMRQCPDAQFVGIAPGSVHENPERMTQFGIPVYSDWRSMLDVCKPDLVILAPVYGLTGSIILECAARGIGVFADKPVAGTREELKDVQRAVEESGIRFSAMHYLRFTPSFYHARRLVEQGGIGDVKLLTAQKSYRYGVRPDWYHDRSLYVGTIPWVGIHAIDWIYYFAGKRFLSVSALQVGEPAKAALCQFQMDGGVIASANIDYLRPKEAPTHGDDRIRVAGTTGVVEVFADHYTVINADGVNEYRFAEAPKLAYDFLLGKEELTKDEIFMLTDTALAAQESADTGKCIVLGAK